MGSDEKPATTSEFTPDGPRCPCYDFGTAGALIVSRRSRTPPPSCRRALHLGVAVSRAGTVSTFPNLLFEFTFAAEIIEPEALENREEAAQAVVLRGSPQ